MPVTPFIGQISLFGLNFSPKNWAFCQGQLLPINSNTALFSLIGNIYGGDARTTLMLPDLQGRAAMGSGQGSGLSNYSLGSKLGVESVTLTLNETPTHNHSLTLPVGKDLSDDPTRANTGYIRDPGSTNFFSTTGGAQPMAGPEMLSTGGNAPHENRQPFLALNYCIALQGIFPSRN